MIRSIAFVTGWALLIGCAPAPIAPPVDVKKNGRAGNSNTSEAKPSSESDGSDSNSSEGVIADTATGSDTKKKGTELENKSGQTSSESGTSTNGSGTAMETEAFVKSPPLSADLMAKAGGRTKSNKTPMGTWFDKAVDIAISADAKKFLEDPTRNVDIPENKKGDWSYKKFNVNLYPTKGLPHPADGTQGGLGDCNMLAFLNSFAYQHPTFLKSIIKDKGNGTYEVQMFDPKAKPITVGLDANFIADKNGNLIVSHGPNNTVIWLTIMEKAIMKYNTIYKIWAGDGPGKVEGFGSEAGAPMLTGEGDSYAFDRGALGKPENLTRVVKEALKAGKLITGGFGEPMTLNNLKSVTAHAYTVIVPKDGTTMISMRNPWGFSPKADGGGDSSHDGILDIGYLDPWFKTIDLRIMEPGIAGGTGNTSPYQPRTNFQNSGFTADDMEHVLAFYGASL